MIDEPQPAPRSHPTASVAPDDARRAAGVDQLQRAVGEGRLTLGEFVDRLDVVMVAASVTELDAALADLPLEQPVVGSSAATQGFSIFGDVVMRGRWRVRRHNRAITVFGDIRFDLRDSVCAEDEVRIEGRTLFGDVIVTVPEGVEAEVAGFTIFGDRRLELAPVPRQPHTPLVRVHGLTLFGDIRVRSQGAGKDATAWRHAIHQVRVHRAKRPDRF